MSSENQVILPAPPGPIAKPQRAGLPAELRETIPPAGCPKLTEALALARDRCEIAAKDATNLHHNYKYASADEVIRTASAALAGSGLALIPLREELEIVGSGNLAFYALKRTVILSHASGEFVTLQIVNWPVIPERGRPLDKAYAIALTSSLAYKLRDLLQMSRDDAADDVAAQDDTARVNTAKTPAPPAPPPVGAPEGADPSRPGGAPDPLGPIGTAQVDRIAALVERLGLSWGAFNDRLAAAYGAGRLRDLASGQADKVERSLEARLAAAQRG